MNEILEAIAPCGLNCSKCFAYKESEIKRNSLSLKKSLGNFDVYARRFVELLNEPTFQKYPDFKEVLDLLGEANCNGCREEKCKLFDDCNVRQCAKEKDHNFCFECDEFPCSNTGFDEHLNKRWLANQQRMSEVGVGKYYQEIKDKPRY